MSYYVTLGGIYISGVTDVSLSSGRDLTAYNGLGNGNFSVPDAENLREWTVSCELSAKNTRRLEHWQTAEYVFKSFEAMLKTKDYSRFIVTSPLENISELVYLKQYSKKEKYNGVYDVEITVSEHKPTQIKTTDVPYISRPGKVPIPPKITVTKKNTIYSVTKNITGKAAAAPKAGEKGFIGPIQQVVYKEFKTGKPISNPVTVKAGEVIRGNYTGVGAFEGVAKSANGFFDLAPKLDLKAAINANKPFQQIKKGFDDYLKKWW